MLMSERTYFPMAFARKPSQALLRSAIVYAAAGWSGFFVMGVELLGGRLLAPFFGSSIFVWGGIIAVFMTCLSAGYLAGGQLSVRSPSLRLLGALVAGAGILGVPIIAVGTPTLEWLSYAIPDPRYGSLAGAFLLFGATTVISGMISPFAVRLLVADLHRSGRSAGLLYFVSTLGSAAGTILTSFYFVLYLELNTIILSMIGVSVSIGALLMAFGRGRA
jgi:hypothetical protein